MPVLLLLGGAAANLFSPEPYFGLPLLACTPLVAAMAYPVRWAVVFATAACAASVALDERAERPLSAVLIDLPTVGLIGLVGIAIKGVVDRQRSDLALSRSVAEAVQRAVLPAPPARIGPFQLAVRYLPAQAEAFIGGDFYAVRDTPFGVRVVIGDVRGKGLQAVAAVSAAVGAFREHVEAEPDLHGLAAHMDRALDREGEVHTRTEQSEGFTTALLVQLDPHADRMTLLNRGHVAPFVARRGRVRALDAAVPDLPLSTGLAGAGEAPADVHPFPAGEYLLLVTDGVTEARDASGTFYEPLSGVADGAFAGPEELADALVEQVSEWTGGRRQDDLALLVITRTAGASLPGATAA